MPQPRATSDFPRIFFVGIPLGALCLLRGGHHVVGAAIGPRDLPGRRRLRRLLGHRAPLLGLPDLEDPAVQELVLATRPDALLSFYWPRRVPATLLAHFPLGAYGAHPSLLPRWRGPDPFFWAVRTGDTESGVSLHHLAAEYDTGDVVARHTLELSADETAWTLARKLDRPALGLIDQAAHELRAGVRLRGERQDEARATPALPPSDEELSIDWCSDAEDVLRLVRAASPSPGALAQFGDALVEVARARRAVVRPGFEISEAWLGDDGVVVRCGEGAVEILAARDEDGEPLDPETLVELARS